MVVFGIEIATIVSAAVLAFLLRFDFQLPPAYVQTLALASIVWVLIKLTSFKLLGLDRRWARYISLADLLRLAWSNLIGSLFALAILLAIRSGVPKSVYAIDFLLCVTMAAGLRIAVRVVSEMSRSRHPLPDRKRTIIYGAGNAGASLLRDIRQNPALTYDICGFVDDDPRKLGLVFHGVRVFGHGDDLHAIVKKHQVESVLIAVPSAGAAQM